MAGAAVVGAAVDGDQQLSQRLGDRRYRRLVSIVVRVADGRVFSTAVDMVVGWNSVCGKTESNTHNITPIPHMPQQDHET